MTSQEAVLKFFTGGPGERVGLWLGQPHSDTDRLYCEHFGVDEFEGVRQLLKDDCRWVMADMFYRHPEGGPMFDIYGGKERRSHGQHGVFADTDSIAEVEAHPWPDPKYLDLASLKTALNRHEKYMRFGGSWSCFYHIVADYFGMENYFIKMHSQPEIVEAVTDHVVNYYLAANEQIFRAAGDQIDAFFFGNDFGSQLDLMISPDMFHRFVMPYFRKLVDQAKSFDLPVMLHSCGSIYRVIPSLIDAGVDALHPLQARAANMEAERLAREFKGKITFVGGVDTQDLLVNGSPQDIRDEVYRLRDLFGERFIVSPSHEALLPNVPAENCAAMAEAALE